MWATIWTTLIITAIATPIYLLYKLFKKLMNLLKTIEEINKPTQKQPYVPTPTRQNAVTSTTTDLNKTIQLRTEIKQNRADRKNKKLEKTLQKWERYGLIND